MSTPQAQRKKAIAEYRVATGWSTSSHQSVPSTRPIPEFTSPILDIPLADTRSNLTQTLPTTHRESLRMKQPSLFLGSWAAGSSAGWARRSMRIPLQLKVQSFRKVETVRLFDLQRPKAVVLAVPPMRRFYMAKRGGTSKGGGFKGTASVPDLHCKCCQRLEHIHSQPIRGDMRITAALFSSPTVKTP